jgi:hypothetical protein
MRPPISRLGGTGAQAARSIWGFTNLSLFAMVTPGIIELNIVTISGPILWFLAVGITPFGLPLLWKNGK